MRFLYKRPKPEDVSDEINTLMEVMVSKTLIYVDLFLYSFIFSVLLSPVLHSVMFSVLFFFACYVFFSCLYFFVFNRLWKKLDISRK